MALDFNPVCREFECGPTSMYEQYCVKCGRLDKDHMDQQQKDDDYEEGLRDGRAETEALFLQKVKELAGKAYANHEDERAELLRDLADKIKKEGLFK